MPSRETLYTRRTDEHGIDNFFIRGNEFTANIPTRLSTQKVNFVFFCPRTLRKKRKDGKRSFCTFTCSHKLPHTQKQVKEQNLFPALSVILIRLQRMI
jgi:hypothetical protein